MSGYTLVSGVDRAAAYPDTFEIPGAVERATVVPGDFVKLLFNDEERMWVQVTDRFADGRYSGTLANEPVCVTTLRFGSVIEFHADHIISIMPGEVV